MGCDIHFFVEYRRPGEKDWTLDETHQIYYDDCEETEKGSGKYKVDKTSPSLGDFGTDYAEKETPDGEKFLSYSWDRPVKDRKPSMDRDYFMFGLLADVRSSTGTALYELRDVPEDTHPLIMNEYNKWSSDAHSASHLYLHEFKEVVVAYRKAALEEARKDKEDTTYAKTAYQGVLDHIQAQVNKLSFKCPEGLFDVKAEARMVFWFDN